MANGRSVAFQQRLGLVRGPANVSFWPGPVPPGADSFPRAGARQASPPSSDECPLSAGRPGRLRRRWLTATRPDLPLKLGPSRGSTTRIAVTHARESPQGAGTRTGHSICSGERALCPTTRRSVWPRRRAGPRALQGAAVLLFRTSPNCLSPSIRLPRNIGLCVGGLPTSESA